MKRKLHKEAGDMIASSPWNPNRELSFGDMIVAELNLRLQKGQLSPVIYNKAVDLTRKIQGQLEHIYGRSSRGLSTAVSFIINKCR